MAPTPKWIPASGAIAIVLAVPALRADPGLEATLGVSSGLEWTDRTDNESATSAESDEGTNFATNLDFGLTSVTRSQELVLNYGTELEYNFAEPDGLRNDRNSGRVSYQYQTRTTLLSFDADYRVQDLPDSVILDEISDTLIISDRGSVERVGFASTLVLGRETPLSLELLHRYNESAYTDTAADSDLRDSTNTQIGARLEAELSPLVGVSGSVNRRELDQEGPDGTQRTTWDYVLDSTLALSRTTSVTAGLNYSEIETNTDAAGEGGVGYSLSVSHDRPGGAYTVGYSSNETSAGQRQQIEFQREMTFPRGNVALSVGATKTEGFSVRPQLNATVAYTLSKNSELGLSLSQQSSISNDDEATQQTQLAANYERVLTKRSSLSGSLSYASRDFLAEDANDQNSLSFNVAYNHDLTKDWSLVSRYSETRIQNSENEDSDRRTLFIGVERQFTFRP